MNTATAKTGNLSIHTENIFPIIKKFLYSNQEVFLRELVSNAVDATQKLKTLASVGEFQGELGELKIHIRLDEAAKTLTISDSGVGMTEAEVEQYINQIAFSSAEDFLGKYKDAANQIIGHFGLGFYSAFMVATKVELLTRSWRADAEPVRWICEGSTSFTLEPAEKASRGTDVILHIPEEHAEYLKPYRIEEILRKHCRFLPIEVEFEGKVINDTNPLWLRKPAELKEEDYLQFYQSLYPFSEAPLFWIHLNVDYPFTLTGILYFPRLKPNMELPKNKIQLYSNQVFITDDVTEVVPDYLTLLHGVIDSPDIPLNVSRSYLQTDANVRKISGYISKKVADKLVDLFQENRQDYEKKWESIGVFVKYGLLRDNTFYERAHKCCLVADTDGTLYTLDEYQARIAPVQTDKDSKVVFLYATDLEAQHAYIASATRKGYKVLLMNGIIDSHFISFIEHKIENATWVRVDADALDKLIDKGLEKPKQLNEAEEKELRELFEQVVGNPMTKVEFQALGQEELPAIITRPEFQRRMKDMAAMGMAGLGDFPETLHLVLNTEHSLLKRILLQPAGAARDQLARHTYDLARLQQGMLTGSALSEFIARSLKMII